MSPEAAACLSAGLSKVGDLEVVERQEIMRVLAEHTLAAAPGSDEIARLGGLLKADGVILLSPASVNSQQVLVATLVSVDVGVRLATHYDLVPGINPQEWAGKVMAAFRAPLRKLNVRRNEATPLSLLNLRMAIQTTNARALERELSQLLALRLSHQKEFFVLERGHLEALAFEKEFIGGSGGKPFWTGSFVIDGVVVEDTSDQTLLELQLSIEPPGARPKMQASVVGSKTDLVGLIDEAAKKITALIGRPMAAVPPWEPAEEAQRFFNEAKSAARIGLTEQALAAAEGCFALGLRTEESRRLLVELNCRAAFACNGGSCEGYDRACIQSVNIDLAQRAMDLASELSSGPEGNVLVAASRIIRYHREMGDYKTHTSALTILRDRVRQIIEHRMQGGGANDLGFVCLVASYAPYWYDDPRDVLRCYRWVLKVPLGSSPYNLKWARWCLTEARDKPFLLVGRRRFRGGEQDKPWLNGELDLSGRAPWLVDWHHESPEQLSRLWDGFLEELAHSKDATDRVDAMMLRYFSLPDSRERYLYADRVLQTLWDERRDLVTNKLAYASTVQVLQAIGGDDKYWFNLLDFFCKESVFHDYQIFHYGVCARLRKDISGQARSGFHNPSHVRGLLQSMESYARRMTGEPDFDADAIIFKSYQQTLAQLLPKPVSTNSTVPSLVLHRFWHPFVEQSILGYGSSDFSARKVICRDKALWVLGGTFNFLKGGYRVQVIRIDPADFRTSTLELPSNVGSALDFDLNRDFIFVAVPGRLCRYARATETWDSCELPNTPAPLITLQGDDLYFAFPRVTTLWDSPLNSGILRFNPHTLAHEVLASSRRKPAQNILDDRPAYKVASIFLDARRRLFAAVDLMEGNPYQRCVKLYNRTDSGEWQEVGFPTDAPKNLRSLVAIPYPGGHFLQPIPAMGDVPCQALKVTDTEAVETLLLPPMVWPDASAGPVIATDDTKKLWILGQSKNNQTTPTHILRVQLNHETALADLPISFAHVSHRIGQQVWSMTGPSLLHTEHGLVLCQAGNAVFWFIPMTDITDYLAAHAGEEQKKPEPKK